mmetsp:Transcript_11389/g.16814  ORF Transcript_11389/g.16814 Transcript_11389/m.16814 type:complete len:404 (-) Transcript_11389:52-1263(-)
MSDTKNEQNTQPDCSYENIVRIRKELCKENPPIDELINSNILPQLIQLNIDVDIGFEMAWIITNVASGTEAHCRYLLAIGAVEYLEQAFSLDSHKLRDQVIWGYGNLFGERALTQALLEKIDFNRILEYIKNSKQSPGEQRAYSFMLANFVWHCKIHKEEILPLEINFLKSLSSDTIDRDSLRGVRNSSNENLISKYIDEELVRILIKACEKRTDCFFSLGVLIDISLNSKGSELIVSKGFLELVPGLLESSIDSTVTKSFLLLSNLLVDLPEIIETIDSNGTIHAAIKKLKHINLKVKEEALRLLSECLGSATLKSKPNLVRTGAVSEFSKCLNTNFSKNFRNLILEMLESFTRNFDLSVFPTECSKVSYQLKQFSKKFPKSKAKNILLKLEPPVDQEDDSV